MDGDFVRMHYIRKSCNKRGRRDKVSKKFINYSIYTLIFQGSFAIEPDQLQVSHFNSNIVLQQNLTSLYRATCPLGSDIVFFVMSSDKVKI